MVNREWMFVLPFAVMLFFVFSPLAYGDFYWEYFVVKSGESAFLPKDMPKEVREQMMNQPRFQTTSCHVI